jgi:hypothetical protein
MATTAKQQVDEIYEVLDRLRDEGHITDWEYEFIESLRERGGDYTEKQSDILDRIYDKVCDSGL